MSLPEIKECKNENPDQIDEVPVKAGGFYAIDELVPLGVKHRATRTPQEAIHSHTGDDVYAVERRHCPVNCQKRPMRR